jgi:V/A-type H+-transporting ATPase subunit A
MMMNLILYLRKEATRILKQGKAFSLLARTNIFEKVIKVKYDIPNDELVLFDDYYKMIDEALHNIK